MSKIFAGRSVATIMLLLAVTLSACHERQAAEVSLKTGNRSANPIQQEKVDASTLRFGFDVRRSVKEDARQYLPFLKYLEQASGLHFEMRLVSKNQSVADALGQGGLDIAAMGATSYVKARTKYPVTVLVRGLNTEGQSRYRSMMVVRPDNDIASLKDIRGKVMAFGNMDSTQGHLIPRIIMAKQGLFLKDLKNYFYTGSHQNCIQAVIAGKADICGAQDTLSQQSAHRGLVRIVHTSSWYPSSGIVISERIDQARRDAIQKALLEFDPVNKHRAGLYEWQLTEMPNGFERAADKDYEPLERWMQRFGMMAASK